MTVDFDLDSDKPLVITMRAVDPEHATLTVGQGDDGAQVTVDLDGKLTGLFVLTAMAAIAKNADDDSDEGESRKPLIQVGKVMSA